MKPVGIYLAEELKHFRRGLGDQIYSADVWLSAVIAVSESM